MRRVSAYFLSIVIAGMLLLSSPTLADFKNFGAYQDTNGDGILNPGDTFLGGFMSWYTHYSGGTSYNYSDHDDDALEGFDDLTGGPYAADKENDPGDELSWLPRKEDELHMYLAWSEYDNTSPEGILYDREGYSLGMIANDYIPGSSDDSYSGGYDLDIAVRDDDTSTPQVTLSDDYDSHGGRPPSPGTKDNASQEFYKIADPNLADPYNHHFQGRWDYTASTGDGGVIGGVSNSDYDIMVNMNTDIVTSIAGDGLVIRIDPLTFDEVNKIVIYDFGYSAGAVDTVGQTPPVGYNEFGPVPLEIPIGTDADKTFFIASIPTPEPSIILCLLIPAAAFLIRRRR